MYVHLQSLAFFIRSRYHIAARYSIECSPSVYYIQIVRSALHCKGTIMGPQLGKYYLDGGHFRLETLAW